MVWCFYFGCVHIFLFCSSTFFVEILVLPDNGWIDGEVCCRTVHICLTCSKLCWLFKTLFVNISVLPDNALHCNGSIDWGLSKVVDIVSWLGHNCKQAATRLMPKINKQCFRWSNYWPVMFQTGPIGSPNGPVVGSKKDRLGSQNDLVGPPNGLVGSPNNISLLLVLV